VFKKFGKKFGRKWQITSLTQAWRKNHAPMLNPFLEKSSLMLVHVAQGRKKNGLLHLVLTQAQWDNLEFNKTQTSARVVTKPKYVNELPERPEDTKSAAWIEYKILKDDFVAIENATKELKDKILRSIPQEDRDELEDSDYGALDLTILQIVQHLTTKYGTMEGTDFETLEQQLLIPLSSQAGLPSHISLFKKIFLQFAASKQPKSELDKCKFFKFTIMHIPGSAKALDNYELSIGRRSNF
jgi:hypothetical protein